MFYELLVGVVPQGHWQPPSGGRSDVPPAIDKLIERGLSNNPRVRPQNIAEYGKLLAEAMKTSGNLSSAFAPWLDKIEQSGFKPLADNIKSNPTRSGFIPSRNSTSRFSLSGQARALAPLRRRARRISGSGSPTVSPSVTSTARAARIGWNTGLS